MLQYLRPQVSGYVWFEFGAADLKYFAGAQLGRQGLGEVFGHD